MSRHGHQLLIRYGNTADPTDREAHCRYPYRGFADDALVAVCHTIAGWAMACLGPVFWICLSYLLLVAEFS